MTTTNLMSESFQTTRKFYDDKNYPRGMSRSGDYSIKEVFILETYGTALTELASGKRAPVTPEEQQFQDVCQEQLAPNTDIEKAWVKYQQKVLTPKHFYTLFGSSKVKNDADNDDDDNTEALDLDDD